MEYRDGWLHSLFEDEVDQIVVVIDTLLVDWRPRKSERKNARPSYTETVVLDTLRSESFNVLLVKVVVLVCRIVLRPIVLDKQLHHGRSTALFSDSSLDLGGRTCHAKDEIFRKVIAVSWTKVVGWGEDKLARRDWRGRNSSAVNAYFREVGRIRSLPQSCPCCIAEGILGVCCRCCCVWIPASPSRCGQAGHQRLMRRIGLGICSGARGGRGD